MNIINEEILSILEIYYCAENHEIILIKNLIENIFKYYTLLLFIYLEKDIEEYSNGYEENFNDFNFFKNIFFTTLNTLKNTSNKERKINEYISYFTTYNNNDGLLNLIGKTNNNPGWIKQKYSDYYNKKRSGEREYSCSMDYIKEKITDKLIIYFLITICYIKNT